MTANDLFKKYETICIYFDKAEEEALKEHLSSLGYSLPAAVRSPILIKRDKTVSFINGYASAVLYSLSEKNFKKCRPTVKRLNFSELSPFNAKSLWYEARNKI